jgi:ABC-type antimicrobial peptide transport system permease subunit
MAGIAVATGAFTILTGASQSSRLEVRGNVGQHFRMTYDLLVRPRGTVSALERNQGLVQQNFLSGIFGGISMDQWRTIHRVPGVDVAAPLAVFGYAMPSATIAVPVGDDLSPGLRSAFTVSERWTADRKTVVAHDSDSYVYVTRKPLYPLLQYTIGTSSRPRAFEGPERRPVCPHGTAAASAFSRGARSYQWCWSTRTGFQGRTLGLPGYAPQNAGALIQFAFPMLIAGIDPKAEARLSGVEEAMTSGRYLQAGDEPREYKPDRDLAAPVLAADVPGIDLTLDAVVRRLPHPAGAAVYRAGGDRRAFRRAVTRGGGTTVAARHVTSGQAYAALLKEMRGSVALDALWSASPIRYARVGDRHLVAQPVVSDPWVWGAVRGITGTGEGFVNAPLTSHDLGFRRLDQHIASLIPGVTGNQPAAALRLVGTFDPQRLAGAASAEQAPLDPFGAPDASAADAATLAALGPQGLAPDGNMAGYLTPPPTLLTTLSARSLFANPTAFSGQEEQQARPISVVRVRVKGVSGPDEASRERIRLVAQRITDKTGLQVDVTAGSSPTPVRVDLPASRLGRPAVALREAWTKKGVALTILSAVDRKSVILFSLVLLVCVLFCLNATSAAVRSRATELGVLACVGWPRRRLFAYLLTEVGLVGLTAGVAGALVSLPVGVALGLPVSATRALIAVPIAGALAMLAGTAPAIRAARSDPLEAVRPRVRATRSARSAQSIPGLAVVNLLRVPGRTVLGALSLGVGIFAFTLLLAASIAFRGAVVGTILGDAVAVQVRGADYVAVGCILVLGMVSVADVLFLNLRDRSAELATLRATGWREHHLLRLVAVEGLGLGAVGGLGGAALGLIAAGAFTQQWTTTMTLLAVAAAVLGMAIAAVASLAPALGLRRLPTATLLAEE